MVSALRSDEHSGSDRIWLKEYGTASVPDLSRDDLRFLIASYPNAIGASIDPTLNVPRLKATSWIGVITLPSGREVRIDTKVPVANVFHMLGVAGEWSDYFRPEQVAHYAPDDTLLQVAARFFRDQCLGIDGAGLYRVYADHDDNLVTVRGRIDFVADVRRNLIERQYTACSFSEFTRDIPENQVLRQTVSLLARCGLLDALADDFQRIEYWWSDITPSHHEPEAALGFTYHRLNEHYRPAHHLAALLLQWLSPAGSAGDRRFPAFLADMKGLYETFVRRVLADYLRGRIEVAKPPLMALDRAARLRFQPDLLFSRADGPALVGDCKYKRVGTERWGEDDVYRMVAYCTALGLDLGVLLFPRHLVDVDDEVVIRGTGTTVKRMTIDLGAPMAALAAECARVGEAIMDMLSLGD